MMETNSTNNDSTCEHEWSLSVTNGRGAQCKNCQQFQINPIAMNNYSKVMSPDQWFDEMFQKLDFKPNPDDYYSFDGDRYWEEDIISDYAAYVLQHSSSGSVWRKASEGFPVEGEPDSLRQVNIRHIDGRILVMGTFHLNSGEGTVFVYYSGKSYESFFCKYSDIEYLDESASRPEIKLPEKRLNISMIVDYTFEAGWNNCIEEVKRLNGIK